MISNVHNVHSFEGVQLEILQQEQLLIDLNVRLMLTCNEQGRVMLF